MNFESRIKIERLNHLSEISALDPNTYIPWEIKIADSKCIMPNHLFSLSGTYLESTLTPHQRIELQKLELAQVMSVYAWSESMACLVFNELLLTHTANSEIGKYLINMSIEEYRHQKMFIKIIENLGVTPKEFSKIHYWMAKLSIKTFSTKSKYLAILAIEQISDMYGRHIRKDPETSPVIKKACELHGIEEGRHMTFQKICLEHFITNNTVIGKSILGIYMAIAIWYMRSQYIHLRFFEEIGVPNPKQYHKIAVKNYRKLFGEHCIQDSYQYANSIGIMNPVTRFFWKIILKAKF